ncbi:MAG: hypothetical protein JSS35_06765 [Proteobacteria bacterium]|nr:hypothetical protein [Pseudomonadota bacterium]
MQPYRLYFLRRGDRIAAALERLCPSDVEAIAWAEGEADGRAMELWCLARRVKSFPATGERP